MECSNATNWFSSGALAYADFRRGVAMLNGKDIHAVELSALRKEELPVLLKSLDELDLAQFKYIAFHAPSEFTAQEEEQIVGMLSTVQQRSWPIVLHPDAVHDFSLWSTSGAFFAWRIWTNASPRPAQLASLQAS